MQISVMKSNLSATRRRFVELLQRVVFGRVEALHIRDGEPVLEPPPRVIRRIKNGGCNSPRRQADVSDFALKQEWVEFFNDLDAIGDGVILSIEVAHGLPIVYEFEDVIPI